MTGDGLQRVGIQLGASPTCGVRTPLLASSGFSERSLSSFPLADSIRDDA